MSAAMERYLSAKFPSFNNEPAWSALIGAATEWRQSGRFLSAAYAMDRAILCAYGQPARVQEALSAAVEDCRSCIREGALDSLEVLAAINLWLQLLRYYDNKEVRQYREILCQELVDRLFVAFGDRSDSVGFLIRGVILSGSLDGEWNAIVPTDVIVIGTSMSTRDGNVSLSLPSAFNLLRMLGDYGTMRALIEKYPEEFETLSLRGWKFAIHAFTATSQRAELFQQAADAFAMDVCPEGDLTSRGGWWSGENIHIWAKYFRARAALAHIPSTTEQAARYIAEAQLALNDSWSGIVNEEPFRLHIIVKALGALVGNEEADAIDTALKELDTARWLFGEKEEDDEIRRFLSDTAATIDDPGAAIASYRIVQIKESLSRMSAIGHEVAQGVVPAIGAHALAIVRGLDHSFVHQQLESIRVERVLQRIFLRLWQANLPLCAQIRQGPLEFGKDVVVLVEQSGRRILHMYQLKIGDIDLPAWRAVTPQLEEILKVPLDSINIHGPVDERIGFLVCNGHATPNAEPAMRGWFECELRDHGHRYEFLHLDDLARWIVKARLWGAFRAALRDVASSEA